jgi:hypothetical protein
MRLIAALLLLILATGTEARSKLPARLLPPAEVDVSRQGDLWTAEYRFNRRANAWVFPRSSIARVGEKAWRPESWTVITPGVRLERRGRYDVLSAADGGPVPSKVKIRFRPFSQDVLGQYQPALAMTDGSVALFSEQFDAFPFASAEAAARLPAELNDAALPDSVTRTTFRDSAGPVLYAGRRLPSVTISDDAGTYVLFGPLRPVVTESLALIVDPQLPQWIRASLGTATPAILARYARELGPPPGSKPTLIVSWAGPTRGMTSMAGSTLPDLIVMAFEGEGVLKESEAARGYSLWFIAHEAAHFWLGQAVEYQTALDSWITEGGADLLAIRTVGAIHPAYDVRGELQKEVDDCIQLSKGKGVATALERNEYRAYYACGAVFAMVAEAASHRPFSAFVKSLVDENRADHFLTREEWLAGLDRVSSDPSLSRDIAAMLDKGAQDPKAAIASLFRRSGVAYAFDDKGAPKLR